MGKVIVIVNDDVSQTLNGTFQVRLGSFESGSEFFIGNVVAALADAHGNSRDRLLGVSLGLVPTLPGRVELRARRACRPLIPDPSPMGAKDEGAPGI
jgi:hypothetical protein